MKTRIALYLRVSTEKQSHDSQRNALVDYAARHDCLMAHELTDVASGGRFTRTGLDELMKLVRKRRVDAVAVYALDRLGRSLQHLVQLIGEFETAGVGLVSVSQNIDTSDSCPTGRLQMHLLVCFAEFERSLIRERVRAGLAAARAKGKRLGRVPTLHRHVFRAKRMLADGKKPREIQAALKLPTSSAYKVVGMARKEMAETVE